MKQTAKKVGKSKTTTHKVTNVEKTNKANKVDNPLHKTNLFNRFLEANCDCV